MHNRPTLLVSAVLSLGAAVTLPASAQTDKTGLAALDANGDKMISRQEAANAQVEAFEAMDTDGDGALTRSELKASQPPVSADKKSSRAVETARAKALNRRFANLDADGSGDISLSEYQAGMTPYFDRLDTNGDGVIDGGELRRAYMPDEDRP